MAFPLKAPGQDPSYLFQLLVAPGLWPQRCTLPPSPHGPLFPTPTPLLTLTGHLLWDLGPAWVIRVDLILMLLNSLYLQDSISK